MNPIPEPRANAVDGDPRSRNPLPGVARKLEILVVEDDLAVLQFLQVALGMYGFTVWTAATGQDAVEIYQEHQPTINLVLMDVQMRGLDGAETFARLQQIDPSVRCCFMSGNPGDHSAEELLRRGAVGILPKPFESLEGAVQFLTQMARNR